MDVYLPILKTSINCAKLNELGFLQEKGTTMEVTVGYLCPDSDGLHHTR